MNLHCLHGWLALKGLVLHSDVPWTDQGGDGGRWGTMSNKVTLEVVCAYVMLLPVYSVIQTTVNIGQHMSLYM